MSQTTPFMQTRAGRAISEIAEDRVSDAIIHMRDVNTVDGKPSEVTIKIHITPSEDREQFDIVVSGATKFSPRRTASSTLYADLSDQGEVEYNEFNPCQMRMPFEE